MAEMQQFADRLVRASEALTAVETADDAEWMLARRLPELLSCLEVDAAAGAFTPWGLSTVVDENARSAVIGQALFDGLHRIAGLEAVWPIGNAGVLHLYGYLLSAVETPYGYKRDRWLGSELASVFGVSRGGFVGPALRNESSQGLLQPVSAALTGVMHSADELVTNNQSSAVDPARIAQESASREHASESWRIRVVVDEFAGEEREEVARAVLVESRESPVDRAVVYAIVLGSSVQLVTTFPISATPESWLADFSDVAPRLRYNAAAHELAPRSALVGRQVTLCV